MANNNTQKMGLIERIGARLPESNILMMILIALLIIASFFAQGEHQGVQEGTTYTVANLVSINGFRWILYNFINNFRSFPPLGVVIVGVIGFGFAEKVGLLGTLIKKVGHSTPEKLILPVIIFVGINSSIASDAGYIVLIPLAAALYAGLGRNPLVGIAASFAAVSAGFGAAMIPTPGDALLGTITQNVWVANGREFLWNPVTMNYLFMIFSTIFLTVLLTVVTKLFVEKRAAHAEIVLDSEHNIEVGALTPEENAGLRAAGIAALIVFAIILILYFTGFLAPYQEVIAETGATRNLNPILDNIIVLVIAVFLFPALAYGRKIGTIQSGKDYVGVTVSAMKDMAYILVFAIFAGNFIAIFSHSGLDRFVANNGAYMLISLNIQNTYILLILFMLICAFVNLFMGSASAKWAILAPIFLMMLDQVSGGAITPDITQAAYRVADSSTNIITPLMTYMGVVLLACKRFAPKYELGDLISLMMPYSIAVLIGWGAFFIIYISLGLPLGI